MSPICCPNCDSTSVRFVEASCGVDYYQCFDCGCEFDDADGVLGEDENDDYYDDSMDGDHASALASIGWGTDEDYGYFGGDDC